MSANEFIDEDLIKVFVKTPGWYPAVAGQMMIYCARAARGASLKHNLYKIRWIVQTWIEELEKEDTKG